jgi:chromosome segregation ATPase
VTTLDQHIQSLQQKMQLLVKKHQQLEKENAKLKDELVRLKETQSEKKQEVEVLEMQNAMLKASQQHLDDKEKKELEKKLSLYIKEIDRCIAMLTE